MTTWRKSAAATAAALLLFAGCSIHFGKDDQADPDVEVDLGQNVAQFAAKVTGAAVVQWSDGSRTHTETVDGTKQVEWRSDIDMYRSVTAMTVVPTGAGSKATCTITVTFGSDDPDAWATLTDKTTGPGKAAVCVMTGESDEPELANPPAITVAASSEQGGARWRATTEVGSVSVEHLAADDEREFHTTGLVQVIVVAQKAGDKVTCDIHTGTITDAAAVQLASSEAAGLGAIATCAATVPR